MRALTEEEQDLLFDERLFNDWRKAQEDEAGQKDTWLDQYLSTFPDLKKSGRQVIGYRNDFYFSFCWDGFLTTPQRRQRTLLFICREANLGKDKIVDQELIPEQGCFWMREQFRNPDGNKEDKCKNYYHPCYRIKEKMSKASV